MSYNFKVKKEGKGYFSLRVQQRLLLALPLMHLRRECQIQIYFHENRAMTADVTAQTRKPGTGYHLPQNEANKAAIFVQCLAKTIQGKFVLKKRFYSNCCTYFTSKWHAS